MSLRSLAPTIVIVALSQLLLASAAVAAPIPEGPEAGSVPDYIGSPARPRAVNSAQPPRHPFMAPNGRSNIHNDAYQTDTYQVSGPLGNAMRTLSNFQGAECASHTFDSRDRIVAICVGFEGPKLVLFDPQTLEPLTRLPLPPRSGGGGGDPFTDFSGGGYFYLDHLGRAVVPTNHRHVWIVGQAELLGGPTFQLERDYDLTPHVVLGDAIISAMPDWSGRIWFASVSGVVGSIDPASGTVKTHALGERISNSFAVGDDGGVFMVSDRALYRFDAAPDGTPTVTWDEQYDNIGVRKPGQTSPGSGTTPTLMGSRFVTITDNDDPMKVLVYRRARSVTGERLVCERAVFQQGAGSTDQSLIATDKSIVVENNFGYTGPTSVMNGATTTPGFERVDVDADSGTCRTVWRNDELSAPSVVPKLSLANGLVYSYTKPANAEEVDAWYFTTLSFRTGATVYRKLAGTGLGFNNNFAPVTLGPDGTAYVGVLGGLVRLEDG